MRVLLDTSVLIAARGPAHLTGGISAASLAELQFGVGVASDPEERARRVTRLVLVERTLDPLPLDAVVCREWGRLAGLVARRGGSARRRAIDLAIAATAIVHGVPLLTHDAGDLAIIGDAVGVIAA